MNTELTCAPGTPPSPATTAQTDDVLQARSQLRDPRVVWIPLGKLRSRLTELPRDREIVCFCKVSQRGYEAQRVLDGEGFVNVKFLGGGLVAWPYPLQSNNDKERK